jgi:hypothetical protein
MGSFIYRAYKALREEKAIDPVPVPLAAAK